MVSSWDSVSPIIQLSFSLSLSCAVSQVGVRIVVLADTLVLVMSRVLSSCGYFLVVIFFATSVWHLRGRLQRGRSRGAVSARGVDAACGEAHPSALDGARALAEVSGAPGSE